MFSLDKAIQNEINKKLEKQLDKINELLNQKNIRIVSYGTGVVYKLLILNDDQTKVIETLSMEFSENE